MQQKGTRLYLIDGRGLKQPLKIQATLNFVTLRQIMKKIPFVIVIAAAAAILLLGTSYSPVSTGSYTPMYMKVADFKNAVTYESAREMSDPGKIHVRGSEIFINERYKGVHVIDNSDPANPENKAFIVVPGCLDMAVKGDIIYMNSAKDMVAFDLNTKKVTKRIDDFFPNLLSPEGYYAYGADGYVVVGWKKR
jgi:hypothetical protein